MVRLRFLNIILNILKKNKKMILKKEKLNFQLLIKDLKYILTFIPNNILVGKSFLK
jgi:hypothetical protein